MKIVQLLSVSLVLTLYHGSVVSFSVKSAFSIRRIYSSSSVRQASTDQEEAPTSINGEYSSLFSITTSPSGPSNNPVHTLRFHRLPGELDNVPEIVIETGKIGRQAAGAVTLTRGDSVLYATAARDSSPKAEIDFLPLSVEHQERFSSAGMTSGSYNRRDGRPAEHEILTCRLIDRPLRPLIKSGWRHETQLLSWVLSYDGLRSCDSLAIVSSAAALYLSDVPLLKPVAAVQVGMVPAEAEGEEKHEAAGETAQSTTKGSQRFILNPTNEQMEKSPLHLTVAGTADAVLMIEGAADFLPEATFIEAVKFGHEAIKVLCHGVAALGQAVGITKNLETIQEPPEGLQQRVDDLMSDRVDAMFAGANQNKQSQGAAMSELQKAVLEELEEEFPEQRVAILGAFKDLISRRMFVRAKEHGLRCDGRKLSQIRRLDMEAGFLPRVHGSALFTRGETQAIATTTLGDASMRQKIDKLDGLEQKRFYLQYTFPPSCVGETGRVGAPGRREVGHGNLAERALIPTLPSEEEFPYSIRVESLITESHGSSSMASVCGGCLALMDAGVPVKRTVAGIAMGMLLGDKDGVSDAAAVILSDISGTEDALGTMDFKVAGDREGITTFQLDIKCEGLTLETMERALAQAREGRLYLIDEMEKVLPKPREQLAATVPKIISFSIPFESIGKVIGPGGKQIRAIIDDFDLVNMDVNDDGKIQVSGFDMQKLKDAELFVQNLISGGSGAKGKGAPAKEQGPPYAGPEPVEGAVYTGKITGIHPFGVFVEILPGAEDGSYPGLEGLVHVSELARERVRNCEGFMRSMGVEELTVKYLGKENGKVQLSRKAVLEEKNGKAPPTSKPRRTKNESTEPQPVEMSNAEVDIIAQAIDGLSEL